MRFDNDNQVGLSIEPIWLETTLDTRPLAPAPEPPPNHKNLSVGISVMALVLLVAWLAVGWARPSPGDLVARGWTAYHAGSYRAASVALAEARAADPDIAALGKLERAIAVAPMLDEIEKLIEGGQLARAQANLAIAVQRAPRDRRTVATRQLLEIARGGSERRGAAPAPAQAAQPSPGQASPADARATPPVAAESAASATRAVEAAVASRARPKIVKGAVRIVSDAPALVLVDGVLMADEAPTTLRLPVGQHAIELRVPGTGRVIAQRAVRVRAQGTEVLQVQARPAAGADGEVLRADVGLGASQ